MTKADLINKVAESVGLSKKDAASAVETVISSITKSLTKGQSVQLVGFGSFNVKKRAARTGRNPQTGETIKISARKVPSFKAGKALKDALN